jgi:hypothetical protein
MKVLEEPAASILTLLGCQTLKMEATPLPNTANYLSIKMP